MRMASTTMSVAKMKTCEEKISSLPTRHALPTTDEREAGEAMPLQQLEQDEAPAPDADVDLAARQRQEAAALIEQDDLGAR